MLGFGAIGVCAKWRPRTYGQLVGHRFVTLSLRQQNSSNYGALDAIVGINPIFYSRTLYLAGKTLHSMRFCLCRFRTSSDISPCDDFDGVVVLG